MTERMTAGILQAHGGLAVEPVIDVDLVARAVLQMAELPLQALPAARTSLRSGDLFVLRGPGTDAHPDGIGVVERRNGRLGGVWLQPGRSVVRTSDLLGLARSLPGVSGVALLRPIPNQDGRADR